MKNDLVEMQNFSGEKTGYLLPDGLAKSLNLIKPQDLSGNASGYLFPPTLEFTQFKGLVELRNLSNQLLGFTLPPEIQKLQKVVAHFRQSLQVFSKANIEWLSQMQPLIEAMNAVNLDELLDELQASEIKENVSKAEKEIQKSGRISFDTIISLISLFMTILASVPQLKDIYKDFTFDPFTEICGVLNELEKEAAKFAVVNHRSGVPLFQYSKGKKVVDFLMDGTQICFIAEPKGNSKRVKVVYQSENNTQKWGYVERNKLKRLYKME